MAGDSSFDVVSKVDRQEVDNALNQAAKEIAQRYDFKGVGASIVWSGEKQVVMAAVSADRVTAVLDVLVGVAVAYIPALPLVYTAWLSPIVLAWYILTEAGSILENLGELGVKLPPFLVRWVAVLQRKVGQAGEQVVPEDD